MSGEVSFIEFGAADAMTARTFYGKLFGWSFEAGPGGDGYVIDGPGCRRESTAATRAPRLRLLQGRRPRGRSRRRRTPRRQRRHDPGRRRRGIRRDRSASSGCVATTRARRSGCTARHGTERLLPNELRSRRVSASRTVRRAPARPASTGRASSDAASRRMPPARTRNTRSMRAQLGRPSESHGPSPSDDEVAVAVVRLARELHCEVVTALRMPRRPRPGGPCRARRSPRTAPRSTRSRPGRVHRRATGVYESRTPRSAPRVTSTVAVGPVLPGRERVGRPQRVRGIRGIRRRRFRSGRPRATG